MHLRWLSIAAVILSLAFARAAAAQPRPLPTESVEGPGAGNIALQTSVDYAPGVRFTLSGLGGDLWRVGLVRIDVGLSDAASFDLNGGVRDHLTITSRTPAVFTDLLRLSNPSATGDFDDIVVGTKIRVVDQGHGNPAIGVRVATRLPNAKHRSGLGQNTTDFYGSVIFERSLRAFLAIGNLGYGILGDPLNSHRTVGSFLYSVELRQQLSHSVSLVERLDGRTGPREPGLEPRSIARAGVLWTRAAWWVETDGTVGLTERDGRVGAAITTGFVFHAFEARTP